jgi:hypothetical protein
MGAGSWGLREFIKYGDASRPDYGRRGRRLSALEIKPHAGVYGTRFPNRLAEQTDHLTWW